MMYKVTIEELRHGEGSSKYPDLVRIFEQTREDINVVEVIKTVNAIL